MRFEGLKRFVPQLAIYFCLISCINASNWEDK